MKVSDFIFDYFDRVFYSSLTNFKQWRFIHKTQKKWLKNKKKSTINSKNKSSKRFKYSLTAVVHHKVFPNNLQVIDNVRSFIKLYDWNGIDFSAG